MTNIIMIARNRPRLTKQAINSIFDKSGLPPFNLTVVDDHSDEPITWTPRNDMLIVRLSRSKRTVGLVRNIGAAVSKNFFGRGEFVCFLDNDVAIMNPAWLGLLSKAIDPVSPVRVVGGCQHPFHGFDQELAVDLASKTSVRLVDAVAGYSLFMRWETYEKYGPFDANQPGVGASEDWAFCHRITQNGGKVGYIHPPVLAHCGITNTDGRPATGGDQFERIPGLIYE